MPAIATPDDGAPAVAATPEEGLYRQIPEPDDFKRPPNSNMVKVDGERSPDGAGEKMLSEEDAKLADVKFIKDQKNGDTKVDILEVKQAFVGLTKEELMKYCNDPFWVRLRWFAFVLFWAIWLGMLGGAVYIIVRAPKCSPPPPKIWWEEGPIVNLDRYDGDASGLLARFRPELSRLGSFRGIVVPERSLPVTDAYEVPEPSAMRPFKEFADEAEKHHIRLIVDLTPNYVKKTHEWFVKSEKEDEIYKDYFIWGDPKEDAEKKKLPVNNWVSTVNEPAWTYSPVRKQSYLHQFGEETPDLNFTNPNVIDEFKKIIQFWLKNGASGIRLDKVAHLLVDPELKDERTTHGGIGVHTDYSFYEHENTLYQKGLEVILNDWQDEVGKLSNGEGLLYIKNEKLLRGFPPVMDRQNYEVDLSRATDENALDAKSLNNFLTKVFLHFGNASWPVWQHSRMDKGQQSEHKIIMSLLPGVPAYAPQHVFVPGENVTAVDPEFNSLLGLRRLPSVMYGGFNSSLFANQTVFAYTRLKSGNPGIVVLYNPSNLLANVNIASIYKMPSEVTVNHLSKNYAQTDVSLKAKLPSASIAVSPESAIVLTYVPEE